MLHVKAKFIAFEDESVEDSGSSFRRLRDRSELSEPEVVCFSEASEHTRFKVLVVCTRNPRH